MRARGDSAGNSRWPRGHVVSLIGLCFAVGCLANSQPPGGTQVDIKRLSFLLPAGWEQVPPSSSMRAAQAVIRGPGGPAEMAVFYFGAGQGGDVDANLQRWMSQVVPAAGEAPHHETFENGGLRISWVDVSGTLNPGQMGMGPSVPQPGSRLFGAVIEGDGGPWFFKVIGPQATLDPQRDAFVALLRSATPSGG
jgi:hypothetical protein